MSVREASPFSSLIGCGFAAAEHADVLALGQSLTAARLTVAALALHGHSLTVAAFCFHDFAALVASRRAFAGRRRALAPLYVPKSRSFHVTKSRSRSSSIRPVNGCPAARIS